MKRLSLKKIAAMLTVAIASIGLVLASLETKTDTPVKEIVSGDIPLFWHEVLPNGTLGPVANEDPDVAQTKNESVPGGAKEITSCDDDSSEACMRGFNSAQTPGSPAGGDLDPDYQINKS